MKRVGYTCSRTPLSVVPYTVTFLIRLYGNTTIFVGVSTFVVRLQTQKELKFVSSRLYSFIP